MSPQWLTRSERRGTRLSIVFLVATLVMATLLAYSASDAARSHRETAESTLRDYAGLAAWEYSRRARTQLNRAFHTPVHQVRSLVVRAGAPRPSPDVVWRAVEACDCEGSVPAAGAFVRVDLDRRRVVVTGTTPVSRPDWLVEALERRLAADPGILFATAAGPSVVGEGEDFGAFTIFYDEAKQPLAAYGFLVPSQEIGRILREDCSRDGLLPPALTGDLPTDSLVYITVAAASGLPLYKSPVPYDSTFSGRDTLGARFAGLAITAAIRPGAAENLVIGGLPTSRLPWVLGLLLLTLGVGTAALYQFRREQELARMRDRFVSGVSHELRTPLAQIRVFGELLEAGNLRSEGDRSRSVTVICREARRLTHLVENVLQFSTLRRSAAHLVLEGTPVRTLIGETVEAFEPLARQRNAHIVQRVEEPFVVTADRGVLSQMLLNLLDNAVKYGPAGQTVEIGARRQGDTAEIWVRDEGPGVSPAEQERIWEPYYRGSWRSEAGSSGCGIGLALVAELAALHGGRSWVENYEVGARFVVELPGAAGTTPAEPPTTSPAAGASA